MDLDNCCYDIYILHIRIYNCWLGQTVITMCVHTICITITSSTGLGPKAKRQTQHKNTKEKNKIFELIEIHDLPEN